MTKQDVQHMPQPATPQETVLLLGATGTIGRATHAALTAAGFKVVAPVRANPDNLAGAQVIGLSQSELADAMRRHGCTSLISCIASRTGVATDAQAIDYGLNKAALSAAIDAGATHFVLLSAICVQKPQLAFQYAKLAFEAELMAAPLTWSIVRPTAYFKSLSGQINRLRAGKPFLLFGDGTLTACKPISNADLASYLVLCLSDPALQNRILPIGGPGPAITPRAQGELLFQALGQTPRFKRVPIGMMTLIIAVLTAASKILPRLRDKAELARIGRYYATESMLVWDAEQGRYDADKTPEFGRDTLENHYVQLAQGSLTDDRGDHAVF